MLHAFRHLPPNIRLFLGLLLFLAVPCTAQAGVYDNDLDFSVVVGSGKNRWVYDGVERETRINSVTAEWSRALTPYLRGGLRVAYLDLSQAGHPEVVGLDNTGGALGMDLQARLVDTALFQLAVRFAYDYASTDHQSAGDRIENDWSTTTAGIGMVFAPRQNVSFLAGSSVASVDGEEHLSGSVNQITSFEEHESVDYYAGVSFRTDTQGQIGLRWYGGRREGLFLSFSRRY